MHATARGGYHFGVGGRASTYTTAVFENDSCLNHIRLFKLPRGRIILLFCIIYSIIFTYILYTSSIWQNAESLKANVVVWNRFSTVPTTVKNVLEQSEISFRPPLEERDAVHNYNSHASSTGTLNKTPEDVTAAKLFDFFRQENIDQLGLNVYNRRLPTYGGDSVCNNILETTYHNGRLKVFCVQPKAEPDERGYRAWCMCNPYEHTSMCRCRLRSVMLHLPSLFRQFSMDPIDGPLYNDDGEEINHTVPYAYPFESDEIRCFPLSSLDVDMGQGFSRRIISDFGEYGLQTTGVPESNTFVLKRQYSAARALCGEARSDTGHAVLKRRPFALLVQTPRYATSDPVAALNAALVLFITSRDVFIDGHSTKQREMRPLLVVTRPSHSLASKSFSLFDVFLNLLAADFDILSVADTPLEKRSACILVDDLIIVPSYLNSALYRCLKPFPSVLLADQCQLCSVFAAQRGESDEPILSPYQRRAGESSANQRGLAGAAGNVLAGFGSMVRNILGPGEESPDREKIVKFLADDEKNSAPPWAKPRPEATTINLFQKFVLNACQRKNLSNSHEMWPPPPLLMPSSNKSNVVFQAKQSSVIRTPRVALMYESRRNRYDVAKLEKLFNDSSSFSVEVVDVDDEGKEQLCSLATTMNSADIVISYYNTPHLMHTIWLRRHAHVIALQPVGRARTTPYYDILPNLVGFQYRTVQALKPTKATVDAGLARLPGEFQDRAHIFVENFAEIIVDAVEKIVMVMKSQNV